jgi:hypothetical protein
VLTRRWVARANEENPPMSRTTQSDLLIEEKRLEESCPQKDVRVSKVSEFDGAYWGRLAGGRKFR